MRWRRAVNRPAPDWTPDFAVVERFIREVLPTVEGGRHLSADGTGHHALIRQAATDRGLSTKVIDNTTYFYDGPLAVVVVLNSVSNVHVGGENIDVTDLLHRDLQELAVEATRAIPGLGVAGIDLMTPDIGSADRAVVLEANVGANIRVHNCPAYGQPRNVAGAIIGEMIATARRP